MECLRKAYVLTFTSPLKLFIMKRLLLTLSLMAALTFGASAQYYSMINQATNMMQTVFSGGMRYRGMVDASYVQGIGNKRADFLEFSTTQGLKYADWFFMGIGAGVDVMFVHAGDPQWLQNSGKSLTTTACMIPLFTDFRFIIGGEKQIGFFIDIKAGCSFLVGKNNVQIGDGYLNRSECFYLKPGLVCASPYRRTIPSAPSTSRPSTIWSPATIGGRPRAATSRSTALASALDTNGNEK